MNSVVKQQQLDWRRAQVLELASEGYNQREIANRLQVDLAAVNRDIQFLRQKAQDNLQHHIHETLPEEYQKCMIGMKRNLKQTLEIAETVTDPRIKLQARAIATDIYKYIMDLATNSAIVTDAIKCVNQTQKQVDTLKRVDESIKTDEEEITSNGVF